MGEKALADIIRREILDRGRKRILVRNLHAPRKLLETLSSVLDDMRILQVDCTDDNSLRESVFSFFAGDGLLSGETAFEAGWRSHATEISLCSEGVGLEIAAGLQNVKAEIKGFVLSTVSKPPDDRTLALIFSSFAWSLPTLICFFNYSGRQGSPVSSLRAVAQLRVPPVLVCRADSGGLEGSDLILQSEVMSLEAIQHLLLTENSCVTAEAVLRATGGDEGLVKLYMGLRQDTEGNHEDVFVLFDTFLNSDPQFERFARAAALFGMQFLPGEVAILSELKSDYHFPSGKKMGLWRGQLTGCFSGKSVREHLMESISADQKDRMLQRAAEIVLEFRGKNSRSLQIAGDLMVRAGRSLSASDLYRRAAEQEEGDFRKADLYKKAALFVRDDVDRDRFFFLAALNLYRCEAYSDAIKVLKSLRSYSEPAADVLLGLCLTSTGEALSRELRPVGEIDFPELVSEIIESRDLRRKGHYQKAERVLLYSAVENGDPLTSVACLVELGEQLYRRGMVENSLNTMISAGHMAVRLGAGWLERRALFTSIKAWNRLGKQERIHSKLSRLIQLTLLSGNRRKLASVYNLYGNNQLLGKKHSKALKFYSTALRTLPASPEEHSLRIVVLNNIGVVQRKLFHTGDSLRTLMRLVRISVSSGKLSQACIAYGNLARLFIHLGKVEAAEDCLETMIEFAGLGNVVEASEPICYISSQLAFMKNESETAISLIEQSVQLSRESGKKRRLSLCMVKKGSMLLRLKRYREAIETLAEAMEVSQAVGSGLNTYLAEMKLTAAKCFLGECSPVDLLAVKLRGDPDDTHRGEHIYYHWLLTGSRQSMTAAAQLFSTGLSHGLYFHSYLYMLQRIAEEIPASLADAIPLLHNYPSCD
ncbi:MAG: hypothetical protein KAH54_06645 [Candidatus Sabulitectum sp.]|nr:hypothetical protein [Candidatus Sabulitectum sp.]